MSRAAQLDCQHLRSCALVLTLFLFQKGQGFFPPLPIAALFPRSWRGAYAPLAGWDVSKRLDIFAAQKASVILISCWPLLRAMRPVAEWRSESAKRQGAAPDPRAARPVAERR